MASTRPLPASTGTLRAALHARRMLLLKALLVRVEGRRARTAPSVRRGFERDWELLERTAAGAVRDAVDYPTTGAWLAETLTTADGALFEAHLAQLGGVAVAAAVRAGDLVDGHLAVPSGALVLPGLGVLSVPSGRVRLSGVPGALRIGDALGGSGVVLRPRAETGAEPVGEPRGWSGLRTLPGGDAVLDDLDPYRVPPPGIGPQGVPAAERPHSVPEAWARRWRAAHALLAATDPGRSAEVRALVRAVVPLAPAGRPGVEPMSATLRAAPGAVLAQLPADAAELAECLVHETHHTKLAALEGVVALCRPGSGAVHRVGWRPDPRPVPGVLQGAYAHLALADLWWRARSGGTLPAAWRSRAAEQFTVYRDHVGDALSVLRESDELTIAGREFVRVMSGHHAGLGSMAHARE
ncbi:HEXXH motif-containing putative peptide modification protein [Streptomyces sp. NPDC005728]|uniref:aKG-HExxH-type peptide beta-hydroxylase n=1 Tax=Streptomyces sp. NPDC005728 TaxID=3157054 RepID=UPI0033D8D2C4